jgi:hypothetical protein
MKKLLLYVLPVSACLLFAVFCGGDDDVIEVKPVSKLEYTVTEDGDGVILTWCIAEDFEPDEYFISVDSVDAGTTQNKYYTLYAPGSLIEVFSVKNGKRSRPASISLAAKETPSLEVWGTKDTDPDHPYWFGFDEDGTAYNYSGDPSPSWDMDFFVDDSLWLVSPYEYDPPRYNYIAAVEGVYEEVKIVVSPGSRLQKELVQGKVYGLRIDRASFMEPKRFHYAKLYVEAIAGNKVTLKIAYQTEPRLHWVAVD